MKKIGIITIHNSPNYGACLQSYALWKYIIDQGYECEIIDLYRPYQKEYISSRRFLASTQRVTFKQRIKKFIKKLLFPEKKKLLFSSTAKPKFDEFNKQITLSRTYRGPDELYADPPLYDLYISGSDQLWNPEQPYCLEPYFLTFVPSGRKKISYSTSIGLDDISEEDKRDFKKWLASYSDISVREKTAKRLLESFLDKEVIQVADPTFLLDLEIWNSLAIKPIDQKPYLLLFSLYYQADLVEYCLKLCEEAGLSLVVLSQIQPESNRYKVVKDAGPREFIGYIAQAEMFITDSFHGTVFSLIMGAKNFYTYIRLGNKRGSRIIDLLETYQLSNHLLNPELTILYEQLKSNSINRDQVLKTMVQERENSRGFLKRNLR